MSDRLKELNRRFRALAPATEADLRDEVARLQSEVERLKADNDHQRERRNAARDCIKKMGDGSAWLLRKQAEAIDEVAEYFGGRDFADVRFIVSEHAQRLRQQAAESENA